MLETRSDCGSTAIAEWQPAMCERELANRTVFCSKQFIDTWIGASPEGIQRADIPVFGCGPRRFMHGVARVSRIGLRYIELGPEGVFASPGWNGSLDARCVKGILKHLQGGGIGGFSWNVRFDHAPLARWIGLQGLEVFRPKTHVLPLERPYPEVFASYSATIRNQVRRATRQGVVVREVASRADVAGYYEVYQRARHQKAGFEARYSLELLQALAELPEIARFLIAEVDGRIIAGGIFLRDEDTVMHFGAALDRDFSSYFPACAVLDDAIQWSIGTGARFLNMGGSAGIRTLEQFKESWGAVPKYHWSYNWVNPLWDQLAQVRRQYRTVPGPKEDPT